MSKCHIAISINGIDENDENGNMAMWHFVVN